MPLTRRIRSKKLIGLQIALSLGDKFRMRRIFPNSGTKRLGQIQAFRICHISPKKRPGSADIRLVIMDGTSFAALEKDTIAVSSGPNLLFAVPVYRIVLQKHIPVQFQALT